MGGRGLHIALLVHRRARRNTQGGGVGRWARGPCARGDEATDTSAPGPAGPVGGGRWEVGGGPSRKHRAGSLGQHPPRDGCLHQSLWTDSSETSPGRAAIEKALKAKETAQCQRSRSPGVRGHCCLQQTARGGQALRGQEGRVVPLAPKGRAQSLLTSSRCWRWCWPLRPRPGCRAGGHSSRGRPRRPSASRGARRSGPARAAPRAAGTGTTG